MANTNILQGWRCPKCGNEDRFTVRATTYADLTDAGADAGDIEWGPQSYAQCHHCDFAGMVMDFDEEEYRKQVHTDAEIDVAVAEVKDEILDDIRRRTYGMPASVSSYSELHSYVDANEYGGFTDPERRGHWSLGDIIAMQDKVDAWLKAGRPDEGAAT